MWKAEIYINVQVHTEEVSEDSAVREATGGFTGKGWPVRGFPGIWIPFILAIPDVHIGIPENE